MTVMTNINGKTNIVETITKGNNFKKKYQPMYKEKFQISVGANII